MHRQNRAVVTMATSAPPTKAAVTIMRSVSIGGGVDGQLMNDPGSETIKCGTINCHLMRVRPNNFNLK